VFGLSSADPAKAVWSGEVSRGGTGAGEERRAGALVAGRCGALAGAARG